MRDFEKKLALKLKAEAERIVPECHKFDMETKEITWEEERLWKARDKKRRFLSQRRVITSVVAAILILSIFSLDHIIENQKNGYSFQIVAFAGESIDPNKMEERLLEADISMVMPNGQITLFPEDTGPEPGTYGWGTGSFYVTGEDIARVTYSLKNGMMEHYDTALEYKLNLEGNPVQIEFFLPYKVFNLDEKQISEYEMPKYTERFKELWNSGKCPEIEAVKKGYFAGKSLNVEDYTIMNFVGTWNDAQTDGRYFRLSDIALDKQLNKEAHEVTVEYYGFDYGEKFNFSDSIYSVLWSPVFKPYSTIGVTNPADLPGDEMTVTIEFHNGKIIKKVISLSFNKEGYAVAEIK